MSSQSEYRDHLPNDNDFAGQLMKKAWRKYLDYSSKYFIGVDVIGSWKQLYDEHPKLLIISNHSSHLDAVSIAKSMPFEMWNSLYIAAAKDYFFKNRFLSYFSKHCLGAIPIDRNKNKKESMTMVKSLLSEMDRIWLVIFPEGTRSKDGKMKKFKKGISIFSEETGTPVLFTYMAGNTQLWPKGATLPKPGKVRLYLGPVHPPAPVEVLDAAYKDWIDSIGVNPIQESS